MTVDCKFRLNFSLSGNSTTGTVIEEQTECDRAQEMRFPLGLLVIMPCFAKRTIVNVK